MNTITLQEVIKKEVWFHRRVEEKFLIKISNIENLQNFLRDRWYIVVVDDKGRDRFIYKNYYFDTLSRDLFKDINSKKKNVKIRIREYQNWNRFMEVKHKQIIDDVSHTFKKRQKIKNIKNSLSKSKVNKIYDVLDYSDVYMVFCNSYNRKTFINLESAIRITLDFDLSVVDMMGLDIWVDLWDNVIMEIKYREWIDDIVSELDFLDIKRVARGKFVNTSKIINWDIWWG